jgi:hypothetical protein
MTYPPRASLHRAASPRTSASHHAVKATGVSESAKMRGPVTSSEPATGSGKPHTSPHDARAHHDRASRFTQTARSRYPPHHGPVTVPGAGPARRRSWADGHRAGHCTSADWHRRRPRLAGVPHQRAPGSRRSAGIRGTAPARRQACDDAAGCTRRAAARGSHPLPTRARRSPARRVLAAGAAPARPPRGARVRARSNACASAATRKKWVTRTSRRRRRSPARSRPPLSLAARNPEPVAGSIFIRETVTSATIGW